MTPVDVLTFAWSALAFIGVLAAGKAAWEVYGDLHAAVHNGSTAMMRSIGRWQVVLWIGVTISLVCLLIVGISDDRGVRALCITLAAFIWTTIPIGYLVGRRIALQQKE